MHFTPTILKSLCVKYDLTPSKKYGQNFLIQEWPIKKMIEAADLQETDTVIEIGPGFGVLTFALAEQAGRVIGLEIEKKLEGYWDEKLKDQKTNLRPELRSKERPKDHGDIEIIFANALYSLKSYVLSLMSSYKVVANLPYQITSHVLKVLLELENKPESITIMVQKEVAERICSKPGEMSLLSVSVQYYGKPKIIDIVTKGNFWPEPRVDSAILKIRLKDQKIERSKDIEFFRVVKAGFSSKRKQLANNLSKQLSVNSKQVSSILKEVCGNEKVRSEELSVENWVEIAKKLNN